VRTPLRKTTSSFLPCVFMGVIITPFGGIV
jgi:hypothetical protein